jgi:hypothetical protein
LSKRGIPKGYKFGSRKMLHGATQGGKRSPEFRSWAAMLDRCTNPNDPKWPKYGGRGIKVHDAWRTNFAQFLADMGPRPPGTTLDRYPSNDGDYEPGNCRWATPQQQNENTRRNVRLTLGNETHTVTEWARRLDCHTSSLIKRIKRGLSDEAVLTTPFRFHGRGHNKRTREKTHASE